MTRFLVCLTFVAAAAAVHALGAQEPQIPIFRGVPVDTVPVFVTVLDRDGRLVPTLTRDDFEVRDEGKPQPITLFDNSPRAIQLIVMLDVSGSMVGNLPLLRGATEQLIRRLTPEDGARVGTFGHEITISPEFTRDVAVLRTALPTEISENAPTPLWRALVTAMDAFTEAKERRVVLVLSDGGDSGMMNFKQGFLSQGEVIDKARREDVMIYAVGLRSRTRLPPGGVNAGNMQAVLSADLPDPGLAKVAEETGGGYTEIRFGQDLAAEFARVADEIHAQYTLGFEPPRRDGKRHEIEVKLKKGGHKPRARKDYIAPKE
jgi:Ca-activated chloride channel family protein